MSTQTEQFVGMLDERITLLNALAETLVAARQDIVGLDVDGLEARILQQERLCVQVGALDAQLNRLQRQCATQVRECTGREAQTPPEQEALAGRLADTQLRMKAAQRKVKQLNEAHRALLRRCRRTAGALLNSYATFTATYADPYRESRTVGGHASVPGRV